MVILMNGIPLVTDDNQIRELDDLLLKMRHQLVEANETIETRNKVKRQQLFDEMLFTAQQVISTLREQR